MSQAKQPSRSAGMPVAVDARSREVLELAARVAGADVTVMLTGESGVGKEVVAHYIHRHSARCEGPFIALNCAAIPESMLEALLFGYEKGAFTGASESRPGKFELAQGGTLLLDEVTEMALSLQAKLLRVLQEREFERLGAAHPQAADVRVIATSNRDLRTAVEEHSLREDLYYRLNVFPIEVPALRERREDILPLAEAMIDRHVRNDVARPRLAATAHEVLKSHDWPGNVRELENVIQRALILCSGGAIEAGHLRIEEAAPNMVGAAVPADLGETMKLSEGEVIMDALRRTRGSRKAAAERLGISPRTLRYKLARLRELGFAVP